MAWPAGNAGGERIKPGLGADLQSPLRGHTNLHQGELTMSNSMSIKGRAGQDGELETSNRSTA